LKGPCGGVIDQFPTVIRMNNFQTQGFEGLVGSKLSAWCHTCYRWQEKWSIIPRKLGVPEFTWRPLGYPKNQPYADLWREENNPDLIVAAEFYPPMLIKEFKYHGDPSGGLMSLYLFHHLGMPVWHFGYNSFSDMCHYWGKAISRTNHSQAEGSVITQMSGVFDGEKHAWLDEVGRLHTAPRK